MGNRMLLQDAMAIDAPLTVSNTLPLRIAAVFIIFASSLLGSLPPLFLKTFQRGSSSDTAVLVRCFSAGIILALGLVHILPDGMSDMDGLHVGTLVGYTAVDSDYPIGGVVALFGVILMIFMENIAHAVSRGRSCNHGGNVGPVHSHSATRDASTHLHRHDSDPSDPPTPGSVSVDVDVTCGDHHHMEKGNEMAAPVVALGMPATPGGGIGGPTGEPQDHSHGCMSGLRAQSAAAWFSLPSSDLFQVEEVRRYQVVAFLMEVGCVFHSVIIGLSLGVNTSSMSGARALTIALVFHQGLEGLSLGSVIARAGFPLAKSMTMACLYSITTPTGIAVGIAVSSSFDPESLTALAVQGTLNCISAGLLLYIGLVQLIAEDFSREDMLAVGKWRLRLSCYALVSLGASCMCIIAIWA